ncbi:phenylacetic acid degradation bifunctional protein PaaZ [Galactobacter valiniphilus]|uniref:phenylacetic acid degradation bifunctional protein PaaZ n=1 Tax=Galactobacter valiniphilus TaxID=2676122 RepID=UPI003735B004
MTLTAHTSFVPSYALDAWWTPAEGTAGTEVRDASTGELIAQASTSGLDIAAMINHARTVGQAGLKALSLHERALILKQLALYLQEHREELDRLNLATGATKRDGFVDIDGGIGVLFTFSSKGRRELPNANVIEEGPVEVLSKDGSFQGTHVFTALPGVAVQINAFNFPVWGMLEKFAPAFIAGVPTIVKPATPTGYLTEACVRLMVESGLLPAGSIQLVSGSARDILDHLDYRDMVAFTGSAATAHGLGKHVNVTEGGVRFTAETDSLNAAILGPDATEDTPEFTAFIRSVSNEVTAKAGQKCTAVRRVLVPAGRRDAVVAALAATFDSRTKTGDPRAEGATMGPLASMDQLRDVRDAVGRLVAGGGAVAYGDPTAQDAVTQEGQTAEAGAYMSPVVLTWENPNAPAVHEIEAFGPVTSVIEYSDVDDAVRLAAMGGGSLVATICSHDPAVVVALTQGIAAHHGRVHVLDRDDAKTSTGHGSPMPHLIHGGPGRAGGGEELGGIRAVKHHMARTALQGSPDMLTAVTQVWHTGAKQSLAGDPEFGGSPENVHPFRKSLAELRIGDGFASGLRQVSREEIQAFADTTGDTFYAHTQPDAAEANPFFPGIVAHGYLLVSWAAGLFVEPAPGPVLANYGLENLRFITPVAAGDSIRVTLTAKKITPRVTDEYGEVAWDAVLNNQNGELVATYDVLTLVEKEDITYKNW